MLPFVICDDDKEFIEKVKFEIGKVMMQIDEEYKTYLFTEANENLVKMIKSDTPKIYILDVQMPKINGIELASRIRQQDYKSIIIMLTSYNDYKNDIFAKKVMALDYIDKEGFEEPLKDTIKRAVEIMHGKKHINISYDGLLYNIPYEDILYIKAGLNKMSILVCAKGRVYKVNKPLYEIYEETKPNFHRSHRSYIVNVDKIKTVDTPGRSITFKNGVTERLISNRLAKEFTSYVKNYKVHNL